MHEGVPGRNLIHTGTACGDDLSARLRSLGWRIHQAGDARHVLRIAQRGLRRPFAALLDLRDGFDARALAAYDAALAAPNLRWVAAVMPAQLDDPLVRRLLCDHCWDWFTLPCPEPMVDAVLRQAHAAARQACHAPAGRSPARAAGAGAPAADDATADPPTLEHVRAAATRRAIAQALQRNRGRLVDTARELDVSRVTLYRLMQRYGVHAGAQSDKATARPMGAVGEHPVARRRVDSAAGAVVA